MSETVTRVGSKTATIRNNHTLQRTLQMSKSADKAQIRQQNSAAKVVPFPIGGKLSMFFLRMNPLPPLIAYQVWSFRFGQISIYMQVFALPCSTEKIRPSQVFSLFHKVLVRVSDINNIDMQSALPPSSHDMVF